MHSFYYFGNNFMYCFELQFSFCEILWLRLNIIKKKKKTNKDCFIYLFDSLLFVHPKCLSNYLLSEQKQCIKCKMDTKRTTGRHICGNILKILLRTKTPWIVESKFESHYIAFGIQGDWTIFSLFWYLCSCRKFKENWLFLKII